jgi:phosphatidate phosphatase PAH1
VPTLVQLFFPCYQKKLNQLSVISLYVFSMKVIASYILGPVTMHLSANMIIITQINPREMSEREFCDTYANSFLYPASCSIALIKAFKLGHWHDAITIFRKIEIESHYLTFAFRTLRELFI